MRNSALRSRRSLLRSALLWASAGLPILAWMGAAEVHAAQFSFPGHNITVPDGFVIERVAGPPLVDRPVHADFDDEGRLIIADSSGSNDKPEKQLVDLPHRIVRLEDSNGDGVYDKTAVYADKMMFPEGLMHFDGSVYVGAPPTLWKLTDTNGDGVVDQRTEWFKGGTLTGCANDMHGPYLGLDGLIYWAKGAFAKQTHERPGQSTLVTRAAHIFRARQDGTGLEAVMTGGMDNPVEVAFLPNGERFFTTTFVHRPEAGKRDGVVHAVYGGLYGKVNDVLDDHKRTGDLMPVMSLFGAAAPAGLMRYESTAMGAEYQDNLYAALFNLHKVSRHALTPDGATYKSTTTDFVVSDNPDFHPTDVLEDADGSILVVDTGGWYKICCPTSQLAKPDVLGAVYRVRKAGAPVTPDPWGRKVKWNGMAAEQMAELLGDSRPMVRKRAVHEISKLGTKAVPALKQTLTSGSASKSDARLQAVWALTRIEGTAAREAVRVALSDPDSRIKHAATHSAGVWRDKLAVPALLTQLGASQPALVRVAAEALGRIGDRSAVSALLQASTRPADRVLEHSLIFALIEIADPAGTAPGLKSPSMEVRKAALIALDQMDGGGLKVEDVLPLLTTSETPLRQAASWIVARHSEWGGALAGHFKFQLESATLSPASRSEIEKQMAQLSRNEEIQKLISSLLASSTRSSVISGLRAAGQSGMKEAPGVWMQGIEAAMATDSVETIRAALGALRQLPPSKSASITLSLALAQAAQKDSLPADIRLDALAAIPGGAGVLSPALFEFLKKQLDPAGPVLTRSTAAAVAGKARLDRDQLIQLAQLLEQAGPLEIGRLMTAFSASTDEQVGTQLVSSLKKSKGLAGLRPDMIRPHTAKFPASVQARVEELATSMDATAAEQRSKLESLLGQVKGGDVRRGQLVFNSQKAACASCHAIGYLGGKYGPDLTRIGEVRTERDLLEAIVFPSASFVRSYEPMIVSTRAGDEHSGIVYRDSDTEVVIGTGPDTEVRLARADITEMRPGTVSLMPQGLDEQLSRQELSDLLAFLKNTKWGAQ